MSYQDVADMAEDWNLRMRLIACAAQEHPDNPVMFVEEQIWRIAGQPGWGDAWAYANLTHKDVPDYEVGKDDTVVTDGMILSGMQSIVSAIKERAEAEAALVATAATEQAQAEHARQVAIITAQHHLEAANPLVPAEIPAPPGNHTSSPPEDVPEDPDVPRPADGPFEERIHAAPPDEPLDVIPEPPGVTPEEPIHE